MGKTNVILLLMDRPINHEIPFDLSQAGSDPFVLFKTWFDQAVKNDPHNAGVMNLATTNSHRPSSRMVLLKEHGLQGFVFYTNLLSRKGRELDLNPQAALTFWWPPTERQVRIEGSIEKISTEQSDVYFASRPRESQLGAWASAQSSIIDSPVTLNEAQKKFGNDPIPRPCSWGGLRLIPDRFEFWQGRSSRLHDRIIFEQTDSKWEIFRIAP